MFDSVYPVTKVSVSKGLPGEHHLRATIYRFESATKERYLIYVTEYPAKFHTIDFCRNAQKYSRKRFSELTGGHDAGRIIGTAVSLMNALLVSGLSDLVSFGFIGARMSKDEKGMISQRFRIYRSIMKFMISPVEFNHFEDLVNDAYLILNRKANASEVFAVARIVFDKEEEERRRGIITCKYLRNSTQ